MAKAARKAPAKRETTAAGKGAGKAAPPVRVGEVHPVIGLRREIDRLFDRFFGGLPFPRWGRRLLDVEPLRRMEERLAAALPSTDMSETESRMEISVELPGMEAKDVEVVLEDDMLTIRGEKKEEKEETGRDYYLMERQFGAFERSLRLPESVREDDIEATFDKGVLTITLPKAALPPKGKAKRIGVKKK